jgi:AAA domain (dynein-related subfamily)
VSNIIETHTVMLAKPADRALRETVITKNATAMISSVSNKSLRARGWDLEMTSWDVLSESNNTPQAREVYGIESDARALYLITITITYNYHQPAVKGDLAGIVRKLASKSQTPAYGSWTVSILDGNRYAMPGDDEIAVDDADDLVGYVEVNIPDDWESYFEHLYGLDAHIRRVRRAIEAGINSGWRKRLNVVLVGQPGCGKSDIAESVMRALGEDACWRMDATATTAAGTIKELSEMEILPRIAILEEAEKANEKVTEPFLGILDQRGEVNKTTARGKVQRDARLLVISTVNDYEKFTKMNAGALASRHTVKIFFSRPSRDTLALILAREVADVNGDTAWINPTLDYCAEYDITDPREVISHCLAGAGDWLNGQYVADLKATEDQ